MQLVSGIRTDLPDQIMFKNQNDLTCSFSVAWQDPDTVSLTVHPWEQTKNQFSSTPVDSIPKHLFTAGEGKLSGNFDVQPLIDEPEVIYQVRLRSQGGREGRLYARTFRLGILNSEKVSNVVLSDVNYELPVGATNTKAQQKAHAKTQSEKYHSFKGVYDIEMKSPSTVILAAFDESMPYLQVKLPENVLYIDKKELPARTGDLLTLLTSIDNKTKSEERDEPSLASVFWETYENISKADSDDVDRSWLNKILFKRAPRVPVHAGIKDAFFDISDSKIQLGEVKIQSDHLATLQLSSGNSSAIGEKSATIIKAFPDDDRPTDTMPLTLNLEDFPTTSDVFYQALILDDAKFVAQSNILMLTPDVLSRRLVIIDGEGYVSSQSGSKKKRRATPNTNSLNSWLSQIPEQLETSDIIVAIGGSAKDTPLVHKVFEDRMVIHIPDSGSEGYGYFKEIISKFTGDVQLLTKTEGGRLSEELGIDGSKVKFLGVSMPHPQVDVVAVTNGKALKGEVVR